MTIPETLTIYLFCFPFLTACSNDNNETSSSAGLIATKQITELPIGADTPPKSICTKYFSPNENEEYLFFLNKKINSILIFDLIEEKQVRKISIQKEGENGMGRATGFTIRNMDSIYISSAGRAILYLTDTTGLINEKYDFSEPVGRFVPSYSRLASKFNLDVIFREDNC